MKNSQGMTTDDPTNLHMVFIPLASAFVVFVLVTVVQFINDEKPKSILQDRLIKGCVRIWNQITTIHNSVSPKLVGIATRSRMPDMGLK